MGGPLEMGKLLPSALYDDFLKKNHKWNLIKNIDYVAAFHNVLSTVKKGYKQCSCFGKSLKLSEYFSFV